MSVAFRPGARTETADRAAADIRRDRAPIMWYPAADPSARGLHDPLLWETVMLMFKASWLCSAVTWVSRLVVEASFQRHYLEALSEPWVTLREGGDRLGSQHRAGDDHLGSGVRGLGLRGLDGWSLRKTGAYRALVIPLRSGSTGNQAARGGPGNKRLPLMLLSWPAFQGDKAQSFEVREAARSAASTASAAAMTRSSWPRAASKRSRPCAPGLKTN